MDRKRIPFDYSIINYTDLETGTDYGVSLSLPEKLKDIKKIEEVDVFIFLNTKAEVGDKIFTIHAYDMKLAKAGKKKRNFHLSRFRF